MYKDKICKKCGRTFTPVTSRQVYCEIPEVKNCPVCGETFISTCKNKAVTCMKRECSIKYASIRRMQSYQSNTKICEWCGSEFHPISNTQKYCTNVHYDTCEICGKKYEIDLSVQDRPRTCSKECANKLRFINGNPFQNAESREKAKQTMVEKYGVDHPMHSPEILKKLSATYFDRTGYVHPSYNPEVRSKSAASSKHSKFEDRMCKLFDQYNVEYIRHHMISTSEASHEFDFYLPKYKFLIDCDGEYYHSYLDDPDGKHVLDYYDEDRLALIPDDHVFHVIVEGQEEKDIKYIVKMLQKIDSNVFDYEGDLFRWCRSIDFPYPDYTNSRIEKDYKKLCMYSSSSYNPACKLSISAILQFHRSIFDAHVQNCVSPKVGWYDDNMLKRVITNRLIYRNTIDPYKILRGFNISKICPRVSVFNPALARYLIQTYLAEFDSVFDPFSGFSGRLLGACSLSKKYIGQDLNSRAVRESNDLAKFLKLDNYSVSVKDVLKDSGTYECLLTCPPYNTKEIYANEVEFHSCDEWIDIIMEKYNCKRYVFVVDTTSKYSDYVKETIKSTSHFNKTLEHVIVI